MRNFKPEYVKLKSHACKTAFDIKYYTQGQSAEWLLFFCRSKHPLMNNFFDFLILAFFWG